MEGLELGVQNAVLISAFGCKSKRIRVQAMMPIYIDDIVVDHIFLISPQILTQALLGVEFCRMNNIIINFPVQYFTMERDGKVSRHHFANDNNIQFIDISDLDPADHSTTTCLDCMQVAASLTTNRATADYINYHLRNGAVSEVDVVPRSESKENSRGCPFGERASGDDDDNFTIYDSEQVTRCRRNAYFSSDGTSDDRESNRRGEELMNNYDVCAASRLGRYEEGTIGDTELATDTHKTVTDDRAINTTQIRELINEMENLTSNQKQKLTAILKKHQVNLTKKPGKCRDFEYTFQVQGQFLKSNYSRPLRPAVSEEIRQLLKDDILEESHSGYVNPLTVVQSEGKNPRICVDARKINQVTLPDRTKFAPMQEILQRFHGTRYITTLDLSSAFVQVPLAEASRKYTAFEFQSKVYEYKRIPYGFRSSLAGFVRALQTVLGDETCGYVINYVDDILTFPRDFDQHMDHLDTVLNKLTSAGFTINVRKCSICKPEIKFLGHVVSREKLMPDQQRIEAILKYSAPRNQKQLRRFLGVCCFHQRFIINYASYVAPLLVLLQKHRKWKWSNKMQSFFETLRERFAHSIHLVHPNVNLPYIIHTEGRSGSLDADPREWRNPNSVNSIACANTGRTTVFHLRAGTPCNCIHTPKIQDLYFWT